MKWRLGGIDNTKTILMLMQSLLRDTTRTSVLGFQFVHTRGIACFEFLGLLIFYPQENFP